MKTLAVIPARLGATRLSRKPLRLLAGEPLIVRVWERVRDLGVVDHFVIATDHEDVVKAARDAGADVVMTRDDHPSGTDRVAEVAALERFRQYGAILNVQGDEPFVSADAIRGALDQLENGGHAIGTAAVRADPGILDQPDIVKVVVNDGGRALYFSRAPIPFLREAGDRGALHGRVLQHVGIYAYTRDALAAWVALPPHPLEKIERLEQLRPLAAGIAIGVAILDAAGPGGIDTEDDLARANARWKEMSGR